MAAISRLCRVHRIKKGTHAGAFFMSRINVGYFALKYP